MNVGVLPITKENMLLTWWEKDPWREFDRLIPEENPWHGQYHKCYWNVTIPQAQAGNVWYESSLFW